MQNKQARSTNRFLSCCTIIVFFVFSVLPFPGYAEEWNGIDRTIGENGSVIYTANGDHTIDLDAFDQGATDHWQFNLNGSLFFNITGSGATTWSGKTDVFGGLLGLFNKNGVHFTSGSEINLHNADFIGAALKSVDGMHFKGYEGEGDNKVFSGGYLLNEGKISGTGNVGLLGRAVENKGTIDLPANKIHLAAGDAMTVGLSGDNLVSVVVDEATSSSVKDFENNTLTDQIKNSGKITGHKIRLDAKGVDSVFEKAINLSGEVRAVDVDANDKGEIVMLSMDDIYSKAILDASKIYIRAGAGNIKTLGVLRAQELDEQGGSFGIGGIYHVGKSQHKNLDHALTYEYDTNVSGLIDDTDDIRINSGVTLTLDAGTYFSTGGNFLMSSGGVIDARGYDLGIATHNYYGNTLGNIVNAGRVTLGGQGGSNVFYGGGQIVAAGDLIYTGLSSANITITNGHVFHSLGLDTYNSFGGDAVGRIDGDGSLTVTSDQNLEVTTLVSGSAGTNVIFNGSGSTKVDYGINNNGGTVVKNGTGTLEVLNSATNGGVTNVNVGTLIFDGPGIGSGFVVANGASLVYSGSSNFGGPTIPITINGMGVGSAGAFRQTGYGNYGYNGVITLGSSAAIGAGILSSSARITGGSNYNLTKVGSGTLNWQGSGGIDIGGDLIVSAGTFFGAGVNNSNIVIRGGDVTGNGIINVIYGKFIVSGTGNFGGNTNWSFQNLTFGDGTNTGVTTKTGNNAITVFGNLEIKNHETLNASSSTWNVDRNWTNAGTFNGGTSTVNLTRLDLCCGGNTDQTLTSGSGNFYNLRHTGTSRVTLKDNLLVSHDFLNSNGTFDATQKTVTVNGNFSVTGGNFTNAYGGSTSVGGNLNLGEYGSFNSSRVDIAGTVVNSQIYNSFQRYINMGIMSFHDGSLKDFRVDTSHLFDGIRRARDLNAMNLFNHKKQLNAQSITDDILSQYDFKKKKLSSGINEIIAQSQDIEFDRGMDQFRTAVFGAQVEPLEQRNTLDHTLKTGTRIQNIKGNVRVVSKDGKVYNARVGIELEEGDQVVTDKSSKVELTKGLDKVTVSADSAVQVQKQTEAGKPAQDLLTLAFGKVSVAISDDSLSSFVVQTPNGMAGLRG